MSASVSWGRHFFYILRYGFRQSHGIWSAESPSDDGLRIFRDECLIVNWSEDSQYSRLVEPYYFDGVVQCAATSGYAQRSIFFFYPFEVLQPYFVLVVHMSQL